MRVARPCRHVPDRPVDAGNSRHWRTGPYTGPPVKEKTQTRRLGATLGATRTNDFAILRTSTDNRQELARGHELM